MANAGYLLDINTLVALAEEEHIHHRTVTRWFASFRPRKWAICPLTETGFLRLAVNPRIGARSLEDATQLLAIIYGLPGFRFWPILESWSSLTAPFSDRIFGHQQITDACLLGLAIKESGVLVTLDKGVRYLAGAKYREHVVLLE